MEVIIVMAIIGIMSAVAIPSFLHWLPNIRLKSAARDMYSTIQKAKLGAIKENRDWAVIFDPGDNSYAICDDSGDDDWTTNIGNNCFESVSLSSYQSGVTYGHGNVPAGQSATTPPAAFPGDDVNYTNNTVVFNSRGTGSAGYVYLENERQETAFAVGTTTSGTVKLLRWQGGAWQ
ncbi:MAG: GspH/FimT family pseudopilin [Desulfobulbaceae bacterium]|nr:GspH/FimT family pseudopilin [Desulfobulbaceae bacterium]